MPITVDDLRSEYRTRLDHRRAAAAEQERAHAQVANLRLLVFAVLLGLAWPVFATRSISLLWLLLPLTGFAGLMLRHDRIARARALSLRAADWYDRGLARLDDRWAGQGNAGERFRDPAHLYAEDLDLFGRGGLFELLCLAKTARGEETLAAWLLAPAPPEVLAQRHRAVSELSGRLDFREDLAVRGEAVRASVHPSALLAWAEAPASLPDLKLRRVAAGLAVAFVAAVLFWALTDARWPVLALAAVNGTFALWLRGRVLQVAAGAERASRDLAGLADLLARIEREPYTAASLVALRASLDLAGHPPSHRLAALTRLVEALESRENLIMKVVGPATLFTTQLAFALEAWRARNGREVRRWLDIIGELEATASFAGYAYEHPDDAFPEFVGDAPSFEATGLGHPLLPAEKCVRNDVRLAGGLQLLLISGSNMSGKSTMLRSVGAALVMAQAGAPVRARRLCLSPLQLGASLRVTDSLQGGTSRFYAEITRLRRILELAVPARPVLFLLDELLNGTNSHDRRIGAEGVVRGLIARGAIGLVTTHDLALCQIGEALAARARNVHFEDHFENGAIRFDYVMRPGVVGRSNALELMRSIGLEV